MNESETEEVKATEAKPVEETQPEKTGGYGKHPWWYWLLIYVVVGSIVYLAVYYLFFAKSGGLHY